jgi:hypothetical protein
MLLSLFALANLHKEKAKENFHVALSLTQSQAEKNIFKNKIDALFE